MTTGPSRQLSTYQMLHTTHLSPAWNWWSSNLQVNEGFHLGQDCTSVSVISSSAPTSPTCSDDEDLLRITNQPIRRRQRHLLPSNLRHPSTLHRRRRGFITNCNPFLNFSHRGGCHSPFQSDFSQSAQSSPNPDTYEALPLVENAAMLAGDGSGEFGPAQPRVDPSSRPLPSWPGIQSAPALLQLLQRLGIHTIWPCLLRNGISDTKDLSRLTRSQLIRMGVTDVETRATLMTAGQLLNGTTNLGVSLMNKQAHPVAPTRVQFDHRLHDSGISSGNEFNTKNNGEVNHRLECQERIIVRNAQTLQREVKIHHDKDVGHKRVEHHRNQPPISCFHLPNRRQMEHRNDEKIKNNPANETDRQIKTIQPGQKTPVGILRKNGNRIMDNGPGTARRRSSSAVQKTVKIDEKSLLNNERRPLHPANGIIFTYPPSDSNNLLGSDHRVRPLQIVQMKLNEEGIDLSQHPYSNEIGEANIPLRLMQRYAMELCVDMKTIAILFEAERESRLREAGRPVISLMGDIQSQRYLNCDGIKTGSLEDFLTGLGIPMYANRFKPSGDMHTTKALPSTPYALLRTTDDELIERFGFLPNHVQWLRQQASMIPSVLLSATSPIALYTKSGTQKDGRLASTMQRQLSRLRAKSSHEAHQSKTTSAETRDKF